MRSTSEAWVTRVLRLTRLRDWVYLLGIALLAIARHREVMTVELVTKILVFDSVYLCWGYVFNNLFDQAEDDAAKNPFLLLERSTARWITIALSALLLALGAAFGLLIETLAMMALNVVYSVPPVRLKAWLVPSLAANGFFFGFVYYAASRLVDAPDFRAELSISAFVFLMFLPLQYVHHLEHRQIEGAKIRFLDRVAVAGFFSAVLVWVFVRPELSMIQLETLVYAIACLVVMGDRRATAIRLRRIFRNLSAVFGFAILLRFAHFF